MWLKTHSTFKNSLEWEVYLNTDIIKMSKVRAALTRFWWSSHVLNIEMGRRNRILLEDKLCAFCENNGIVAVENEYYFCLYCPRYHTIREKCLKKHLVLYNVISYSNFIEIMTPKFVDLIQDLVFYGITIKWKVLHTNILCFWYAVSRPYITWIKITYLLTPNYLQHDLPHIRQV